jgi:cell division protein FtsI/penicillin-binding protein 2
VKAGELLRVRVAFGALGAVPVFLAGWLGYVQVAQAGELEDRSGQPLPLVAATADQQAWRRETVPAPRGTILDRSGATLAADCETYEVRMRISVPRTKRDDLTLFRPWLEQLADRLAMALVADPEIVDRSATYARHRQRLRGVLWREWQVDRLPGAGTWPDGHPRAIDVLVGGGIDRLQVIDALRAYHKSKAYPTLFLHLLHSFRRVYPERELTYGIVGHTDSYFANVAGRKQLHTFGVCGLESFAALSPDSPEVRRFRADGRYRPYFVAPIENPPEAAQLHSTLDLELQRACVNLLAQQCEDGLRHDADKKANWGAMVLVEIATGDVLAASSWHRGELHPKATSFTPYQNRFEPGSIVKPLVLAYALEANAVRWDDVFDCNPHHAMYRDVIRGLGRRKPVRDDHDCERLTPHGILLNSSNIGAAMVGLRLSREQWQDYMRVYGWGTSLGLRLPQESLGGHHPRSFAADIPLRGFRANSAISFSFGYEMEATAMQVARAYLRMLGGIDAELRVVRGVEIDGEWHAAPRPRGPGRQFRPEVRSNILAAMRDVVSNNQGATGRVLHGNFQKEGIELHRLVGGKTGTAVSSVGLANGQKASVRNASFVGVLPAEDPKWLAVCVLQKDGRARFYGGSYAAPPAVRLLLRCHELRERDALRQEPRGGSGGQTRMGLQTPDQSGWNTSAGADDSRETR